jgi:hypothetical protein
MTDSKRAYSDMRCALRRTHAIVQITPSAIEAQWSQYVPPTVTFKKEPLNFPHTIYMCVCVCVCVFYIDSRNKQQLVP